MDNSERAAELYGKIAGIYVEKFPNVSEHIDGFLNMVPERGKIVDIGCGPGTDADYMRSKGFDVTGLDLSEDMIALAKKRFPGIDFRRYDMRSPISAPDTFDGVLAAYSINYIPKSDTSRTLAGFYRALKKGGVLYVAVQEGKSEEVFINEPLKPDENMFLNVFSEDEISSLVEGSGFRIVNSYARDSDSPEELDFKKLFLIAVK